MKWLFLVHQVQTTNSRERVKVWRLTKKVGTLLYRNSVYVLPYSKERLEDFHWLCQEIRDSTGEASVFVSEAGDVSEDRALRQLFTLAAEKEYAQLEKRIRQFESHSRQLRETPSVTIGQMKTLEKGLNQLDEAFRGVRRVDFFHHPSGDKMENTLKILRLALAGAKTREEKVRQIVHHARSEFKGKTWATRAHIHIDRVCSAWLIKRFIDKKARFIFAPEEKLPTNAVQFDVFGAEFSHQGDRCTFETLLESFRLKEKGLQSMAELVHEIDLKDQKFNRPESAGLDMIVRALSDSLRNDQKTLELGSRILDAIFARLSLTEK